MPLPKSLLITALIFAAVWGLVIWKNAPLMDEQIAEKIVITHAVTDGSTNPAAEIATNSNTPMTLVGIKKQVNLGSMNEINQHWQDFYELNELHGAVSNQISNKIYGYYRALDDNFNRAELTIGYNSQSVPVRAFEVLDTLHIKQFSPVIENSKSWDTTPAWNAIDTSRAVMGVLEEYVMGSGGNVTSTSVYVRYE